MFRVSATSPWPAKAASPWRRIGRIRSRAASPARSCLARTIPSTTGSTASRWLGFGASPTFTRVPSGASCVPTAPRWYLTSPEPWIDCGSRASSNSAKICATGFPTTLVRSVRRPRWDIPMTASSIPNPAARSRSRVISGMAASPPSREKRLWPTYLAWRNFSKLSASTSLASALVLSSTESVARFRQDSIRSMSHFFCSGSWMFMYSAPTLPQ